MKFLKFTESIVIDEDKDKRCFFVRVDEKPKSHPCGVWNITLGRIVLKNNNEVIFLPEKRYIYDIDLHDLLDISEVMNELEFNNDYVVKV